MLEIKAMELWTTPEMFWGNFSNETIPEDDKAERSPLVCGFLKNDLGLGSKQPRSRVVTGSAYCKV